jgi:hypothetical protein
MSEPMTTKDVHERLCEAARTLRALPDKDRPKQLGTNWPDVVRDACEAYGWDTALTPRLTPSAAEISRMEECFTWLSWLDPRDRRIVWLRAEGVRWRAICARIGRARQHAWRRQVAALSLIANEKNRDFHRENRMAGKKGGDKRNKFRHVQR